MPTRFLACLLVIAIAWISLFAFDSQHRHGDHDQRTGEHAATVAHNVPTGAGSLNDHYLDDVPLQSTDSGIDLPDHQPTSRASVTACTALAAAAPECANRYTTVFLDGLLRPPLPGLRS